MFGDQSSSSPYVTPSSTAAFGPPSSTPALGTPPSTPAMGTPSGNSAFRQPSSTLAFGPPSWNPGFGPSSWNPALGPPSWNPGFGPPSWNPALRPPSSTPNLGTPSWNPAAFGQPSWNPSFVTPWTPAFVTPSTFQQQTPLFNFQQPHSPSAFEFEFESYMPLFEEPTPFPDFDLMTEIDHVSLPFSLPCRKIPFSLPNRDIKSTKESISNLTDVSLKITKHLLTTEGKDKNMVYSPLSIQIVMWLLTAGSKGPTKGQLLSFLKSKSVDELNSLATHLVPLVFADGSPRGGPCLSFANGLWVKESLSIKPSFKEVVDASYKADINHVSFQNPEKVRLEVNLWAEKATKGLITEALPPGLVDKKTILIFSNALYFKGLWTNKFNASNTREDFFRLLNGHYVKAQFMRSYEAQFVEAFDGFKVAKLPYKQGEDKERQFSMYFLLPHARNGLPALVERVCSEPGFLDRHRPARQVPVGAFKIPRFKITSGFKASDILQDLGLVLPFTDGLTEMVESDIIKGKIFHISFIEVEEEGTKAAAVSTFVGCSGASARPIVPIKKINFVADHPFLFFIREERTETVMFIGQVLNPLKE
ncbi:serpin-ZX-like [Pyrus communis]|uniref:serpin-ZX-like n=1 Tax=Pyrus communis TaxID=23211 RepID=UPI0035BF937A